MHCVSRLLDGYYDDELPPGARRRVKAHLRECPTCREYLARMSGLSDLLSKVALPDTLTQAEVFGAQVALRLSRRVARRSRYGAWAWHLVPLLLLCGLVVLQSLFVLSATLGAIVRFVEWLGVDVGSLLSQFGLTWFGARTLLGVVPVSTVSLANVALTICLYLGLLLVYVPYVGWIGALWRSTRTGQTQPVT